MKRQDPFRGHPINYADWRAPRQYRHHIDEPDPERTLVGPACLVIFLVFVGLILAGIV